MGNKNDQTPLDVILDCIFNGIDARKNEDVVIEELIEIGLCEGDACHTIEMVRAGYGRAILYNAGAKPENMSSNFEKNVVFLAALERASQIIKKLPPREQRSLCELKKAIKDNDSKVRQDAAYDLGKIDNPEAIEILIAATSDPDQYVKINALQALRDIRPIAAVPVLCEIIKSEKDTLLLINAMKSLVAINDLSCLPFLIDATQSADVEVRLEAAIALGEIGDESALKALRNLFSDKSTPTEEFEGIVVKANIHRVCDHAKKAVKKIIKRQPKVPKMRCKFR